jgi:hypothetical protein
MKKDFIDILDGLKGELEFNQREELLSKLKGMVESHLVDCGHGSLDDMASEGIHSFLHNLEDDPNEEQELPNLKKSRDVAMRLNRILDSKAKNFDASRWFELGMLISGFFNLVVERKVREKHDLAHRFWKKQILKTGNEPTSDEMCFYLGKKFNIKNSSFHTVYSRWKKQWKEQ